MSEKQGPSTVGHDTKKEISEYINRRMRLEIEVPKMHGMEACRMHECDQCRWPNSVSVLLTDNQGNYVEVADWYPTPSGLALEETITRMLQGLKQFFDVRGGGEFIEDLKSKDNF